MSALEEVFSKSKILTAWNLQKGRFHKRTAPGIDGISRNEFAANIEFEAEQISALIRARKYKFSNLRPFAIPKPNGKVRLINVPTIRDRFVQRMLLDFLIDKYGSRWKIPNSFTSMGIEGEGTHGILKEAAKNIEYTDYVIKADLSAYFDTIVRSSVKDIVRKNVRHRSLHWLIFSAIDCETATRTPEEKKFFAESKIPPGKGIRQGMPLSPLLAFLYLADVDRKMDRRFFRYVDDMLFIGSNKAEATSKFEAYVASAKSRGLSVHPLGAKADGKTYLIGPRENFEFLGMTIERTGMGNNFLIPSESKARIEQRVEDALKIDPKDKKSQKGWLLSTANKASNLIRHYRSAYALCRDWEDYEKVLKQLQLNMCRKIAGSLGKIEKTGDKELLLRLFGI